MAFLSEVSQGQLLQNGEIKAGHTADRQEMLNQGVWRDQLADAAHRLVGPTAGPEVADPSVLVEGTITEAVLAVVTVFQDPGARIL